MIADVELTQPEINDLRAKVALESIQAKQGIAPVVNLTVVGGPLGGMALTMADDARCQGLICLRIDRKDGAVDVVHRREGDLLKFARVVKFGP